MPTRFSSMLLIAFLDRELAIFQFIGRRDGQEDRRWIPWIAYHIPYLMAEGPWCGWDRTSEGGRLAAMALVGSFAVFGSFCRQKEPSFIKE